MNPIQKFIARSSSFVFILYAGLAAFCTYSCMYAFRKSFSVAIFEGMYVAGFDYKSLLIIAQVLGYLSSKCLGIKVISEMNAQNRSWAILLLIGISELALLAFAFIPSPYNIICLFLNGLPLGMIWGLVFSYLEGRRTTEILGAILSMSFIVASNISKSVAQFLIQQGVSEFSMPYIVGLIFSVPLMLSVYLLHQLPAPDSLDEKERIKRVPMTGNDRRENIHRFFWGLFFLIITYTLLTAYRDLQSNFASDIWLALGYASVPSVYMTTTLPMTAIVLMAMALLYFIKDNLKALIAIQGVVVFGFIMIGMATFAYQKGIINGLHWVILVGAGTYLGYIPFNCFLFERMIAAFKITGNAGFFIYLADSFGYTGSVATLIYKNLFQVQISWFDFIINSSYFIAILGSALSVASIFYFIRKQTTNHLSTTWQLN